ncbi:hypothetical protein GO495_13945 [Chitinophaga oryziterrae]|uniref:Uncharacterized protein n=1 Tax=Chitinophaga oryziterrae TaxID=1031224 RepID=A0A6N8JBJ3_9BACT|nr:hypothetical protein [Chitinophaga oryziterrae]MVT41686.1 hypothetical protein [Chitinophaga oryziterrae]
MARLKNGLLGGITGAIGDIEGYMLNGKYIVRSRRRKSIKPPTEKQLACRKKGESDSRFGYLRITSELQLTNHPLRGSLFEALIVSEFVKKNQCRQTY